MTTYASTIAIAVLGTGGLVGLHAAPGAGAGQVAAILPPWSGGALQRAAATGLPIIDARWGGRVIVLDSAGHPGGVAALRRQGFWVLDANGTFLCGAAKRGMSDDRVN